MRVNNCLKLTLAMLCTVCGLSFAHAAGPLKVGTNAEYAPFEFTDSNHAIVGFDVDIINAIAHASGFGIELVNMEFDDLGAALTQQRVDMVIAALSITPERYAKYDFSDAYYASGLSIMVRKADQGKYHSSQDLTGQKICVLLGSTAAETAEEVSPGQVAPYPSQPEAFAGLRAGECEAVINDRPVNLYFIASSGLSDVVELSEVLSAEDYAIAVRKGDAATLKLLNDGLKKLRASGEFVKIHRKWFSVAK